MFESKKFAIGSMFGIFSNYVASLIPIPPVWFWLSQSYFLLYWNFWAFLIFFLFPACLLSLGLALKTAILCVLFIVCSTGNVCSYEIVWTKRSREQFQLVCFKYAAYQMIFFLSSVQSYYFQTSLFRWNMFHFSSHFALIRSDLSFSWEQK